MASRVVLMKIKELSIFLFLERNDPHPEKKRICQIKVYQDSHLRYSYVTALKKLLAEYASKTSKVTFIISAQMMEDLMTEERLKRSNHIVVMSKKYIVCRS